MNRFDGQVAITTGAASGIGRQIALRFAREGGISVIADLDFAAARATSQKNCLATVLIGREVFPEVPSKKGYSH